MLFLFGRHTFHHVHKPNSVCHVCVTLSPPCLLLHFKLDTNHSLFSVLTAEVCDQILLAHLRQFVFTHTCHPVVVSVATAVKILTIYTVLCEFLFVITHTILRPVTFRGARPWLQQL